MKFSRRKSCVFFNEIVIENSRLQRESKLAEVWIYKKVKCYPLFYTSIVRGSNAQTTKTRLQIKKNLQAISIQEDRGSDNSLIHTIIMRTLTQSNNLTINDLHSFSINLPAFY